MHLTNLLICFDTAYTKYPVFKLVKHDAKDVQHLIKILRNEKTNFLFCAFLGGHTDTRKWPFFVIIHQKHKNLHQLSTAPSSVIHNASDTIRNSSSRKSRMQQQKLFKPIR
ncbi:hypothetical protein CEXT_285731 [Caerostris extrusa]|uniref:Uncharacterized protein n=1 Tax=Caerostris extrusa TaxID=172846 RepID=A0AAV4V0D2_CAEEX|nr:hypothetical protein CEXT_285731 [Caerostris extrusa]